jgi:hypothetical protein
MHTVSALEQETCNLLAAADAAVVVVVVIARPARKKGVEGVLKKKMLLFSQPAPATNN